MKINLYNIVYKKTRTVMNYIENMQPHRTWTSKYIDIFNNKKDEALKLSTPNKMLDYIGYNKNSDVNHKIYDEIFNMIDKEREVINKSLPKNEDKKR